MDERMGGTDGGGLAASPPSPGGGVSVAALHEFFKVQRPGRQQAKFLMIGALAVIGAFVGLCYQDVRRNFSADRLQEAAAGEAEQLLPDLSDHAAALLRELRPTYAAEGKKALRAALPELQGR